MINEDYIKRKDVLNLSYYNYNVAFTGSFKEMRYRLIKREESILLSYWFSSLCFDKTNKDDIKEKTFVFSEEGMCEAISYLNNVYYEYENNK